MHKSAYLPEVIERADTPSSALFNTHNLVQTHDSWTSPFKLKYMNEELFDSRGVPRARKAAAGCSVLQDVSQIMRNESCIGDLRIMEHIGQVIVFKRAVTLAL